MTAAEKRIILTINKAEVLRLSRTLSRDGMKSYLRTTYGLRPGLFEQIMREILPPEGDYQRNIMEAIRTAYPAAFVWKNAAGPYSQGGIPDIGAIVNGRFYGFEVKRPYLGKVSKLQEMTIANIRKAGGVAKIVIFPEDALEVIK